MVKKWKNLWTKSTLLSLGLGQLLSLLVVFAGYTSSQIAKKGIYAPLSQSWLSYVLLALFYGGHMIYRKKSFEPELGFPNLILASFDMHSKISVIRAYEYTFLTSIMLSDCWKIPCVMLLSRMFLKTRYGFRKVVGATVCVAGLVTIILSDIHTSKLAVVGDLVLIFGGIFYGVSHILEEIYLKKLDRVEIMASLGICGSILLIPQIAVDERSELKSILSSPETIFLVIGFSIAMFLFYSGVSLLLKINGSTMLNLSLLTSNMWAVLIRVFAYHEKVDWIYFVAFATVALGLIVYSGGDHAIDPNNIEAAPIVEEAGLGHSNNVWIRISSNDGA